MSEKFPFPRSQKFKLSTRGEEAVASYAQAIADAQTGSGQAAFEAAKLRWAQPWALKPDDAMFLTEYGSRGKTVTEAASALETCGSTLAQVKAATTHLVQLGMLVAAPREDGLR